jgi:Fe-S cluster biogenesis protein NfuA/nitrite reductase/ring-hydroxylating ferredoxin subunit
MTATEPRPAATDGPSSAKQSTTNEVDFETLAKAVDDAHQEVQTLDDEAREAAEQLQAAIEGFHRPALVHIVRTLRADPRGKELLFQLVDEPSVRSVLALHGIIRADPLTRATTALQSVRPYLQSHGGDVELVELDGPTAVVRLHGSCNGCSMSAVTLREGVEQALVEGVEEITGIRVLEDEPTTAFIPLASVGRRHDGGNPSAVAPDDPLEGWVAGPAVDTLSADQLTRFDVGSDSFIITNVDSKLAVFRNECVHQGRSLDAGLLSEGVLTCPWHGFTFDATSGECISAPGAQLQPIPARIDEGTVWLRVAG